MRLLLIGANGNLGRAVTERASRLPSVEIVPATRASTYEALAANKYDAVVNIAGAFELSSSPAPSEEIAKRMWEANVASSMLAARLAMESNARVLVLTGAASVHRDDPMGFAVEYAMAKSAVHSLAMNLSRKLNNNGTTRVRCILPGIIDSPANRASMPKLVAKFTPPQVIADRILAICTADNSSRGGDVFEYV